MSKVYETLAKYIVKFAITYLWDHVAAYIERRKVKQEQEKKDEEQLQKLREAVKNGTEQEIENETEKYFRG